MVHGVMDKLFCTVNHNVTLAAYVSQPFGVLRDCYRTGCSGLKLTYVE